MLGNKIKIILRITAVALLSVSTVSMAEEELNSKYYGGHLCAYDAFNCIKVKRGTTWAKQFPNKAEREIVKRLNRINIPLRNRRWIVVPADIKTVSHMDLSPFPDAIDTGGKKKIIVKLGLHAFGAYDESGQLVHWGPVSGGKGWCSDINRKCETAVGSYRIIEKKGPSCVSKIFPVETGGGAPMPYCMHYYRGFALHGSTLPGFHASHGCLRVFHDDAKWLNREFLDVGTPIVVMR